MGAPALIKLSSILGSAVGTTDAAIASNMNLNPERKTNGVSKWVDQSGGIAIGYPSMTLSVRPPQKGSRLYKVTQVLNRPTLEITSPSTSTGIQPQPTLAYSCQVRTEWMLPERSSLAERTALFNLYVSSLFTQVFASDATPTDSTGTPVRDAVFNFTDVWG
jgi:hypothetical protein